MSKTHLSNASRRARERAFCIVLDRYLVPQDLQNHAQRFRDVSVIPNKENALSARYRRWRFGARRNVLSHRGLADEEWKAHPDPAPLPDHRTALLLDQSFHQR
jgi:hypothetical protein